MAKMRRTTDLKVGQVMEILRQRGVRLIAINDNVDTDKGDNDMTPFLNIMYEFYARDTSRKIKSVFKAKGMSGKHLTGFVPYGYLWDEKQENWIVDGERRNRHSRSARSAARPHQNRPHSVWRCPGCVAHCRRFPGRWRPLK